MIIREYGEENAKALLFFQGSCEPWQEFAPSAVLLGRHFHVFQVVPDGHDPEEHTDFISVEKTVEESPCRRGAETGLSSGAIPAPLRGATS